MSEQVDSLKNFSSYLSARESQSVKISDFEAEKKQEMAEIDIPTGEVVSSLLSVTFSLIAVKKGGHWSLSQEEADTAGKAYGDVIDKYFPDSIGSMGAEITAVMVTAMLIMPRLKESGSNGEYEASQKTEVENNVVTMPINPVQEN